MTDEQNRPTLDEMYLDIAQTISKRSRARRKKVGALIVNPIQHRIVSYGYNGTPKGFDNNCEIEVDGQLVTSPLVLHAELNAIIKLAKYEGAADGCTLFVTLSPCLDCSRMIIQSGINRVVYREEYRNQEGLEFLRKAGITVEQISCPTQDIEEEKA